MVSQITSDGSLLQGLALLLSLEKRARLIGELVAKIERIGSGENEVTTMDTEDLTAMDDGPKEGKDAGQVPMMDGGLAELLQKAAALNVAGEAAE